MATNEDPIIKKATPFAFTGEPKPPDPHEIDVDETYDSLHHTIGAGPTQAAPGNHKHKTKDITDFIEEGGIVTDHGQLSGLADDDHLHYHNDPRHALIDHTGIPGVPTGEGSDHGRLIGLGDDDHTQYHNNARGDARYPLKTNGTGASGTWPINITGNAQAVDGQSFSWSDSGTIPTYFWGTSTNGWSTLIWTGRLPQKSVHNFGSVTAGSQKSATFTKRAEQVPFCTVDHKSSYLLAHVETLSDTSFEVEIRNSTNNTDHTNCKVNILLVQ